MRRGGCAKVNVCGHRPTRMDPLDFLTDEELLRFFRCKKTEMSCIEQPRTFLNQLRDHNLVPEDIYKKVIRMKSRQQRERGVYQVLDWLETERPHCIKVFWNCVFADHIMQLYPALRLLRNSLQDGSFSFIENLPEKEETSGNNKEEDKEKEVKKKLVEKRGKKRKKSVEEEEEEEAGPSSPCTPKQRTNQLKHSFSSPLGKGEKDDIWSWPFYKTQLPVTCGDKEGSLNRDKLARGEKCILAEGRWFSPQGFEEFGGRKSSKNWKISIRCRSTPLHKLIQEGHLKCPTFNRRQRAATQSEERELQSTCSSHSGSPVSEKSQSAERRRKLFPSNRCESAISVSDADSERGEEEEDDDEEEEEKENGEKEQEDDDDDDDDGGEERRDDVDLSRFGGPRLPVTCGSAEGILKKDRFASGTLGKCIRTADRWLTPAEFVKEDPAFADSFWKRSILCEGEPLSFLIERKVLRPHSLLCKCPSCSGQEEHLLEQQNDDDCFVCGGPGSLVCCDECPRAFHSACHLPPVDESLLGPEWLCTYCVMTASQGWWYESGRTLSQALSRRISDFMLQCQLLLLQLYNSDKERVFSLNPCLTVTGYRNFIKNPMWFEKVSEKLQNGHYSTVREFFADILLIFDNCATFNKNNEFGEMGARLKQLFDREFRRIFRVQQ
ncbi:nuclear body protein SP140-like [Megalops cyprinoides]|uniref:nuclear body protein SP140-like n=1 Tax=Megalops cyprinoides TaxID=118141 RepID=UPI001865138F|nr:nuclear body protein SP140-like [Megalops cyprinoides]